MCSGADGAAGRRADAGAGEQSGPGRGGHH